MTELKKKDHEIASLQANTDDLQQKLGSIKSDNQALQQSKASLSAAIDKQGEEFVNLRAQSAKAKGDLEALTFEKGALDAVLQARNDKIKDLKTAVATSQKEINTHRQTIGSQKTTLDLREKRVADTEAARAASEEKLNFAVLDRDRLRADLDVMRKKLSSVQSEKTQLSSQIQDVQRRYDESKKSLAAARRSQHEASTSATETDRRLQDLQVMHERTCQEIEAARDQLAELSQQLDVEKDKNLALSAQLMSTATLRDHEHHRQGHSTAPRLEPDGTSPEAYKMTESKTPRFVLPPFVKIDASNHSEDVKGQKPDMGASIRKRFPLDHRGGIVTDKLREILWQPTLIDLSEVQSYVGDESIKCGYFSGPNWDNTDAPQETNDNRSTADSPNLQSGKSPESTPAPPDTAPSDNAPPDTISPDNAPPPPVAGSNHTITAPFTGRLPKSHRPSTSSIVPHPTASSDHNPQARKDSSISTATSPKKRPRSSSRSTSPDTRLPYHRKAVCKRCLDEHRKCSSNGECRSCEVDGEECRYFQCPRGSMCRKVMCNMVHPKQWLGRERGHYVVN